MGTKKILFTYNDFIIIIIITIIIIIIIIIIIADRLKHISILNCFDFLLPHCLAGKPPSVVSVSMTFGLTFIRRLRN